ncbi:hypothetical protein CIT26_19445 [Mesorhizobium temperatum]|uniref:Uncharacterized protein n=2 Tax=Mesorhizobium temperatum TaxID=241416 RepID=A0A271LJX1_9HYPH|nr:hypothetical protein CIT26_19445 [Mesorhizobium temperatum]
MLFLPERFALDKQQRVFTLPAQEVATEFLRMEYTDRERIIPDLYVRALGHEFFVEVAVTHFSDAEKVERLRKHGVPSIEIDLSKLPRDSTPEAIAEAVLRSAKRQWLFHPNIDKAEAKREEIERQRQAELAESLAKPIAQGKSLTLTYKDAVETFKSFSAEYPRKADLEAVGIAEHVGIKVPGFACFTVTPAVWQSMILIDVFHESALGNQAPAAIPIANYLEKRGLIRPQFKRIPRDVADYANSFDWNFAPPWKAVDSYLKHLAKAGVLFPQRSGMALSGLYKSRLTVVESATQAVKWILAQLPAAERGNMTAESWLDSVHADSGLTFRAALQPGLEFAFEIGSGINAIAHMLAKSGPVPRRTFGLPIEAALERHSAEGALRAAEQRKERLEEVARYRQSRRDRLCVDVEQALTGPAIGEFLNTKRADLGGMTPVESAEDSEVGLSRARELLSNLVRQREDEAEDAAERQLYREKITADAKRTLSAGNVESFLNARDDDLGRMTPLLYVRDEDTYRKALVKLSQWEREFGWP